MIHDGPGQDAAKAPGGVGAGLGQAAVTGPVVGHYLVSGGVVGLHEDGAAVAVVVGALAGGGAGRPGDRAERGGHRDRHHRRGADTSQVLHACSSDWDSDVPRLQSRQRRQRYAGAPRRLPGRRSPGRPEEVPGLVCSDQQTPAELAGHPGRLQWNARYERGFAASFVPHPLAVWALAIGPPDGPVLDLACGPSGSALLAAEAGRPVTAVDVSDVALGLLGAQARSRGLSGLITLIQADLLTWRPPRGKYSLVLCTGYWDRAVFAAGTAAVAAGGLLRWGGVSQDAPRGRPGLWPPRGPRGRGAAPPAPPRVW